MAATPTSHEHFGGRYVDGHFFFSSRRRHTRLVSDWSSDVCSSDLLADGIQQFESGHLAGLELMENALGNLPESMEIGQMREDYPTAFEECRQAFPADRKSVV